MVLKMGFAGCDGAFWNENKVSQRAKVCFEIETRFCEGAKGCFKNETVLARVILFSEFFKGEYCSGAIFSLYLCGE